MRRSARVAGRGRLKLWPDDSVTRSRSLPRGVKLRA